MRQCEAREADKGERARESADIYHNAFASKKRQGGDPRRSESTNGILANKLIAASKKKKAVKLVEREEETKANCICVII